MELSQVDPNLGAVFYTVDQTSLARPRFQRNDQCLECHASAKTMGVPGHVLRSFATESDGTVNLTDGIGEVTDATPLSNRWAGWYVTGTHGDQIHRGNLIGKAAFERQNLTPNYNGNKTNLTSLVDLKRYQTGFSDVVALMVLEHQTHLQNFITRLNYEAATSLAQYGHLNYLKNKIDALARAMIFSQETALTNPVAGVSGFSDWFEQQGPRDKKKRSLRDFDLHDRLFKYRCSYLIYSEAFNALPASVKEQVYRKIWEALDDKSTYPEMAKISTEIRRATREILIQTKEDFVESLHAREINAEN